jgi:predicted nuclease of predicted toxin-antitoxin system
MLLLDQGLPRSAAAYLKELAIPAMHAAEVGLSRADDADVLEYARQHNLIVATLDADFHAHLALTRARKPSVIRIRMEGLRGAEIADLLARILRECEADLAAGSVVSVSEKGIRIRRLPLPPTHR